MLDMTMGICYPMICLLRYVQPGSTPPQKALHQSGQGMKPQQFAAQFREPIFTPVQAGNGFDVCVGGGGGGVVGSRPHQDDRLDR